jgi:bifunctional non-homologous end joining protein LigD
LPARRSSFRAVVSTEDGLGVRSRRGWNMTAVLPELRSLPAGLVLDGELVAWRGSEPFFPLVCRRVLNRDMSIPLTFVIFDVLRSRGRDLTGRPYVERRAELDRLRLNGPGWATADTFNDGRALFEAVCRLGYEGVVAKQHTSVYSPGERGWVKVKNPNYWRRDAEIEAMQRSRARRV